MKLKIINTSPFSLPEYASKQAAGVDLKANISEDIVLKPLERRLVSTGISIALEPQYEAQIRPRSGLAYKHGITVLNSPGTIDSDYRGEIKVLLINLSDTPYKINSGDRIAQMVIARHETITWEIQKQLPSSIRDHSGFGSTGKK